MLELAHQGAQVMQVRAVELGWVNDVVIEVLSSFEDAPGTLIKEDPLVEQRNKVRGHRPRPERRQDHPRRGPRPARRRPRRLRAARRRRDQRRHDRPERGPRRHDRHELHRPAGRAGARPSGSSSRSSASLGFREMTTDASIAKVSIVGAGHPQRPGYAARMFGALSDAGVNIEMISTSEVRITCTIAEDRRRGGRPGAPRRVRAGEARPDRRPRPVRARAAARTRVGA